MQHHEISRRAIVTGAGATGTLAVVGLIGSGTASAVPRTPPSSTGWSPS